MILIYTMTAVVPAIRSLVKSSDIPRYAASKAMMNFPIPAMSVQSSSHSHLYMFEASEVPEQEPVHASS